MAVVAYDPNELLRLLDGIGLCDLTIRFRGHITEWQGVILDARQIHDAFVLYYGGMESKKNEEWENLELTGEVMHISDLEVAASGDEVLLTWKRFPDREYVFSPRSL